MFFADLSLIWTETWQWKEYKALEMAAIDQLRQWFENEARHNTYNCPPSVTKYRHLFNRGEKNKFRNGNFNNDV